MQDKWATNKDNSHNNRMRHMDNATIRAAIWQRSCCFSDPFFVQINLTEIQT